MWQDLPLLWCCWPAEAFLTENAPCADLLIRPAVEEDEAATIALWRAGGLVSSYNDPHADFRFARVVAFYDRLGFEEADVGVMQRWLDGT